MSISDIVPLGLRPVEFSSPVLHGYGKSEVSSQHSGPSHQLGVLSDCVEQSTPPACVEYMCEKEVTLCCVKGTEMWHLFVPAA